MFSPAILNCTQSVTRRVFDSMASLPPPKSESDNYARETCSRLVAASVGGLTESEAILFRDCCDAL